MSSTSEKLHADSNSERLSILAKLEDRLEIPMLVLSFLWLILMIVELTKGLSPFLERFNLFVWMLFILDFSTQFILAPSKSVYLKRNWITAIALLLPAFRLFRIFRALRLLRTLRLARVLTSLNRGITALGKSFSRRGFGYVMLLTFIVMFAGAAGILAFERENGAVSDYGTAVWWTAMTLTTMGTDYFPQSSEGRLLCLLLAIYGFAVFGYVTAAVATFFVGRDAESSEGEIAGQQSFQEIKGEMERLQSQMQSILESLNELKIKSR